MIAGITLVIGEYLWSFTLIVWGVVLVLHIIAMTKGRNYTTDEKIGMTLIVSMVLGLMIIAHSVIDRARHQQLLEILPSAEASERSQ